MAFPPSWMSKIARWSLLLAVVSGVAGGVTYARWASEWNRPKPKFNRCFAASTIRLMKPETESGTEPHDTLDGRTVYLTPPADTAVRCAQSLGKEQGARLVDAMGEFDPNARAGKLVAMMEAVPRDTSGDMDALALGRLAGGALRALPSTDAVIAAQMRVGDLTECRFGGPACQARPAIPLATWLGVDVAIAALLVALGDVARGAVARRRAPRAAPKTSSSAEAPSEAKPAMISKKKKKKKKNPASQAEKEKEPEGASREDAS